MCSPYAASPRLVRILFLAFGISVMVCVRLPGQIWMGGTDGNWTTAANWNPATVPNTSAATAEFGASGHDSISETAQLDVGTLQFDAGADAYTITITANATYPGLTIGGAGIINNSSHAQQFDVSGTLLFEGTASGNNSNITVSGAGTLSFTDSSSLGNSTINSPGISLADMANAANATINLNGGTSFFEDMANAANATINLSGGTGFFEDNFEVGYANITIENGDNAYFESTASAGNATITIDNGSSVNFDRGQGIGNSTVIANSGGTIDLTAGVSVVNARIVLNSGSTLYAAGPMPYISIEIGSLEGAGNITTGVNELLVGSRNTNTTFSGVISSGYISGPFFGSGVIVDKVGAGSLTLTGQNNFYGNTTVSSGALIVNGAIMENIFTFAGTTLGGLLTVDGGATLGGNGTIGDSVLLNSGALLAPGNGIGSLSVGNLAWSGSTDGSATAQFTLSDTGNTSSEVVVISSFTDNGAATYKFDFGNTGFADLSGDANIYTLITFASTDFTQSDFSYVNLDHPLRGTFILNSNSLQFEVVVPEPAIGGLALGSVALLLGLRRRRKSASR